MTYSEEFAFKSGENALVGTLHRPAGPGPHPALIMLQGSGPADRDSNGYFPPLRDNFLNSGLAVLSWDKPGVGQSTGHWTRQTLFDRADDAIAALDWLRSQTGIDRGRVGIWGQSQGGWVGPLAASQYPDLAFLIVNSGPAIGPKEQDLYGLEHTMRAEGASDEDIQRALERMHALHDMAIRNTSYDEVAKSWLESARGTPGFDYFGEFGPDEWHFFIINAQRPYDPIPPLELITCPILAVFGEEDRLVPVALTVRAFESARKDAPDRDITTRVFPGADHRIKLGEPLDFAPGYLDFLTEWIWDRIRAERQSAPSEEPRLPRRTTNE